MAGEADTAVLEVLLQKLMDESKSGLFLIRGIDKERVKLVSTLYMIQTFLKDAKKHIYIETVKIWLKELDYVVSDANNFLDDLNDLLSMKARKPTKKKVHSCFSFSNRGLRLRQVALRIKQINNRLDSINEQAIVLGLEISLDFDFPTLLDATAYKTDSFTVDPICIGRDDVVLRIVEMLKTSTKTDERVSIISIVGMGGLGKTTLTRKVFSHPMIKTRLGSLIWVDVSQIFF